MATMLRLCFGLGSSCTQITCESSLSGSFGCIYTFNSEQVREIISKLLDKTIRLMYYTYSENNNKMYAKEYTLLENVQSRKQQIKSINNLLLHPNSVKVFYDIKNPETKNAYEEEITSIYTLYKEVYDKKEEELDKWTTHRIIRLVGVDEPIYGISIQPTVDNIDVITVNSIPLDTGMELYMIPQFRCTQPMDRFVKDIIRTIRTIKYHKTKRIDMYYRIIDKQRILLEENIKLTSLLEDLKLFEQNIIDSIKILFSKGYVHRDIKLENMVYCAKSPISFKLIDFGFFHKAGDKEYIEENLLGTPGYRSIPLLTHYFDILISKNKYNYDKVASIVNPTTSDQDQQKKLYETIEKIEKTKALYLNEEKDALREKNLGNIDPLINLTDTIFTNTAFTNKDNLEKLEYLSDLYALCVTFNIIRKYTDINYKNPSLAVINPLLENGASYMQQSSTQGGGKLQLRKLTDKKIHLLGRHRVVYIGKHGKQYIRMKNTYVAVSTIKKRS